MTRILIQRGNGSSSSQTRSGSSSSSGSRSETQATSVTHTNTVTRDGIVSDDNREVATAESAENGGVGENRTIINDESSLGILHRERSDIILDDTVVKEAVYNELSLDNSARGYDGFSESSCFEKDGQIMSPSELGGGSAHPPPPPLPPKHLNLRKSVHGISNSVKIGSPKRAVARPTISGRTSPSGSHPSSPRSIGECEGYNSADEQNSPFVSSFDDTERERQFEIDIRRCKGYEVRRMLEDGNCLFRAVADQVYGDSEAYDVVRQMCLDYMERERDHFSQFITEGFISYCKRKRRDKVYGNNVEIQALSEMYNRPIHIYSYSTEPINIFHGNYTTDSPPVRLSYHHGNHYNSLVDPRCMSIGAGLGFSCLRGRNVDRDQVKAAIKAQQDQQIDNALIAEGQFYSDLELTEKEIERMVMETSRAEYLANGSRKQHGDITSGAEPSSSGASSETKVHEFGLSSGVQMILSMGFTYMQAIEAHSIFGDDVDSMVCYLLETGGRGRRKGKAAE